MNQAILNFLATRLGALVVPAVAAAIASAFAWAGTHIPYGIGAYLASPESQTAIVGVVFGAILSGINYLTTSRGFKYGQQVQQALNLIGTRFGVTTPPDGVVGPVTAQAADVVAASVVQERKNVSATIAADPNRKG